MTDKYDKIIADYQEAYRKRYETLPPPIEVIGGGWLMVGDKKLRPNQVIVQTKRMITEYLKQKWG